MTATKESDQVSSSITGHSAIDELPGPDGSRPLEGDRAGTGRLGVRIFGAAGTASRALE